MHLEVFMYVRIRDQGVPGKDLIAKDTIPFTDGVASIGSVRVDGP
jgi:hypothetical protein